MHTLDVLRPTIGSLYLDWTEFLTSIGPQQLKHLLTDDDRCQNLERSPPVSLVEFVRKRHCLASRMEQHLISTLEEVKEERASTNARGERGMPAKKFHEVEALARLIGRRRGDRPKVAVDVGSGVGHLGRALHTKGFKVIGLERDSGHSSNAKRRTSQVSSSG